MTLAFAILQYMVEPYKQTTSEFSASSHLNSQHIQLHDSNDELASPRPPCKMHYCQNQKGHK